MSFPVYETHAAEAPPALLKALGLTSVRNVAYNHETNILLLEIASPHELANLAPDFPALLRSHDSINGVLVTPPSNDVYDFHSRYFWPWSGTRIRLKARTGIRLAFLNSTVVYLLSFDWGLLKPCNPADGSSVAHEFA